ADDEIRIGQIGYVEVAREPVDRHGTDRQFSGRDGGRYAARGARDFLAGAVIEGDDQDEPAVVLGQLLGFVQQPADIGGETLALTHDAHPHATAGGNGGDPAPEKARTSPSVPGFRPAAATSSRR